MTILRRSLIATLAAPLALALAACGSDAGTEASLEGEPVAAVAPPAGKQWSEVTTVTQYDGYQIGNPDAPIKLVEYGSLTCGACANFTQTGFEQLREKYIDTGKVSFEVRNQVHNGIDLILARLVRCSGPEAMVPLSEQVWMNLETVLGGAQQNQAGLEQAMALPESQRFAAAAEAAGLLDFFAARGLSRDQAKTCLADVDAVKAIADRSDKQSQEFDVTGTPTFFVNGRKVEENSWAKLEPILQRAGAR
ncbi:thioredoxin domain-containing protein [Parerythrobacter aurantius]|uniref:thioredoxin domain-containing protein n=1 Tax=Parerythrobacter aurantius TaxID=3127706 RepID=UPI003250CA1A